LLSGEMGSVRLGTLVLLRWLAIIGQTIGVLVVQFLLQFDIALGPALTVIVLSAWINIVLMVARPGLGAVSNREAGFHLAYDVVQLALLLAVTGGAENPFIVLFIAPVAVAASVLRPWVTAGLAGLALICIGALWAWHLPLPWAPHQPFRLPVLYAFGLSIATVIGLAFTSVYSWRVAMEEQRLTAALAAVQMVLAREQKLAALGGLAAATAHELGTPLATIHLVAKEMERALPQSSPLMEDVQLLVSQSERCRTILRQLAINKEDGDAVHARVAVSALLHEISERHLGFGATIEVHAKAPDSEGPEPVLVRSAELIHGIGNLVENAVGFAAAKVELIATWSASEVEIVVRDDGPGFQPSVLPRLGEPYISDRGLEDGAGGGLGLGVFIAKTLLERIGARISFRNRTPPRTGAVVRLVWQRSQIEAPPL
jgi:two-component system sensor histidine kinase RegB